MDLKSGNLLWPRLAPTSPAFPSLQEDLQCDVAIIGAGLSGAMIARALTREGLDVVVLDKREPGCGSTSASTALVLYELDTPLVDLIRLRGYPRAVRSYQRCFESIDELERLVRQLGHRCGFRRRHSLYVASESEDVVQLKAEFVARRKAGIEVEYLSSPQVRKWFSFSAPGAIYSTAAAEIDPLRLTRHLLRDSRKHNARIFSGTKVTRISERRVRVRVETSTRHWIEARWVVVAAGFETWARAARKVVRLKSSYALATRPVKAFTGWRQRCLIWETSRPYFYLRTTPDNRILIGGEDEVFLDAKKRDRLISRKQGVLAEKLRQLFPDIPTRPEFCWAGTFGETKDGLPYIGPLKPQSRILCALCYGANGTNFAVIASDLIRDCILGRRNPDAPLFGFQR